MIAQIRHFGSASAGTPAPPRPWIAFDAALVAIPNLYAGVLLAKSLEFDQESSALILVLTLGPALRHAQVDCRAHAR